MSDYAFELVVILELQKTFGHCHRSMPRVSASRKSVRRGFRNHVQLRDREVRLSRETLHHCIESRQLFARNGPRAAGKQSDFVREEICERIRADRNSQAQGHPISPAKILTHHHQEKCEDSQQKSCANNSHCAPRLLIRPTDSKSYLFRGNAERPSPLRFYPLDSRGSRGPFRWRAHESHSLFLPIAVHSHMIPRQHLASQDLYARRILNQPLN